MNTVTTKQKILNFLLTLAVKAGLAAASVVIVVVVGALTHVDVATLPVAYQSLAVFALPVIISALDRLKLQVDAQEAATLADKQLATVHAQLADSQAALAHSLSVNNLPPEDKGPVA